MKGLFITLNGQNVTLEGKDYAGKYTEIITESSIPVKISQKDDKGLVKNSLVLKTNSVKTPLDVLETDKIELEPLEKLQALFTINLI